MQYSVLAPVPELAGVVDCLWLLQGRGGALEPETVLPDGRPELILHLGEPFERLDGRAAERQPSVIYAGQLTRLLLLRPSARTSVLGVRFHPHGAAGILPGPQHQLAGVPLAWTRFPRRSRASCGACRS